MELEYGPQHFSRTNCRNPSKDGNKRFVAGVPVAGKADRSMRLALASGQAPHTALVGCADSRVPLETVFDALAGDLFVLRNAGNTCATARRVRSLWT